MYWAAEGNSAGDGLILQQTLNTTGPPVTLASSLFTPLGVAVDTLHVYFTVAGTTPDQAGTCVMVAPIGGGSAATTLVGQQMGPSSIVSDGTNLYWSTSGDGSIVRFPLAGGTPTTLVTAVNAPFDLTVDSKSVYWTDQMGGSVLKLTPK